MMKKILFFIGGAMFIALMTFNVSSMHKAETRHVKLSSIIHLAVANAEDTGYSCTVTTNCVGGSISYTGTQSCSRTSTSVTCDGHTTNC
jgi:hypothetical protein